jgi:hypothetical protein
MFADSLSERLEVSIAETRPSAAHFSTAPVEPVNRPSNPTCDCFFVAEVEIGSDFGVTGPSGPRPNHGALFVRKNFVALHLRESKFELSGDGGIAGWAILVVKGH